MKIVAGMGSIDEYERFVEARADEFFCGYVPYSWSKKYGTIMPLNRREVLCYNVQLGAFSELEILSDMIKKYKKPVHLDIQFPVLSARTIPGNCRHYQAMHEPWISQLYYCRSGIIGLFAGK